jgi:hypothetical protein
MIKNLTNIDCQTMLNPGMSGRRILSRKRCSGKVLVVQLQILSTKSCISDSMTPVQIQQRLPIACEVRPEPEKQSERTYVQNDDAGVQR